MGDVARLVRAPQLLVAALGVLAGCWIALGGLATPPLAWWAALAAIGLGAAGQPGRPWLPIVLAIGFVPVSLLLPARAGDRGAYFVLAIFAQLAVLVVATRLIVGRSERLGLLLKGAMAVGLVALVAGRVG